MLNAKCRMIDIPFCIMHSAFCIIYYLPSIATATSNATFIMVVKAV